MCGRFTLFVTPEELEERFGVDVPAEWSPSYNVAPGQRVATIDGEGCELRRWGLVPNWADEPDDGHVNARSESIEETPSFRDAVASRRCLVPADGFYEWTDEGGDRRPYRIAREDDQPFAMAGVWARWEGERAQVGLDDFVDGDPSLETEVVETVAITTTAAREPIASLHDRMPVILSEDRERDWLAADEPGERASLLEPRVPDDLRTYPVSTAVDDPGNDAPDLVEPLAE